MNHRKILTNVNDELAHRCDDLLKHVHNHRDQITMYNNSNHELEQISSCSQYHQAITLQRAVDQILFLIYVNIFSTYEKHEHNIDMNRKYQQTLPYSNSSQIIDSLIEPNLRLLPSIYQKMKQLSKNPLLEINNRLQQDLINEIRQRNYLRAKIFRIRLR